MIQQITTAKLRDLLASPRSINSMALTFPSLADSGRVSGSSSSAGAVLSSIFVGSSSASIDVLSTEDILVGIVIALFLAFTASFLQARRVQSDFVLWDKAESGNISTTDTGRIFGADSWMEMSRPDNYVLYNQKVRRENRKKAGDDVFLVEPSWVLLGLMALFIPIFSIEFFFTMSRQLICESGSPLVQPDLAGLLCSPAETIRPLSSRL